MSSVTELQAPSTTQLALAKQNNTSVATLNYTHYEGPRTFTNVIHGETAVPVTQKNYTDTNQFMYTPESLELEIKKYSDVIDVFKTQKKQIDYKLTKLRANPSLGTETYYDGHAPLQIRHTSVTRSLFYLSYGTGYTFTQQEFDAVDDLVTVFTKALSLSTDRLHATRTFIENANKGYIASKATAKTRGKYSGPTISSLPVRAVYIPNATITPSDTEKEAGNSAFGGYLWGKPYPTARQRVYGTNFDINNPDSRFGSYFSDIVTYLFKVARDNDVEGDRVAAILKNPMHYYGSNRQYNVAIDRVLAYGKEQGPAYREAIQARNAAIKSVKDAAAATATAATDAAAATATAAAANAATATATAATSHSVSRAFIGLLLNQLASTPTPTPTPTPTNTAAAEKAAAEKAAANAKAARVTITANAAAVAEEADVVVSNPTATQAQIDAATAAAADATARAAAAAKAARNADAAVAAATAAAVARNAADKMAAATAAATAASAAASKASSNAYIAAADAEAAAKAAADHSADAVTTAARNAAREAKTASEAAKSVANSPSATTDDKNAAATAATAAARAADAKAAQAKAAKAAYDEKIAAKKAETAAEAADFLAALKKKHGKK